MTSPFGERFERDVGLGQFVECEKGVRGIGAAAAESGSVRGVFGEMDFVRTGKAAFLFKKTKGAGDEIAFVGRNAGGVAVEGELIAFGEGEFVGKAPNGKNECFKFVKSIVSFTGDAEGEIDFGGSGDCHDGRIPSKASIRPVFPFSTR